MPQDRSLNTPVPGAANDEPGHIHTPEMRGPTKATRAREFVAAQMIGGRARQEDDFAILDLGDETTERLVLVVADGMGGHPRAADAARLAIVWFYESLKTNRVQLFSRLVPAVEHANAQICLEGTRDPSLKGAGCTLVAAAIEDTALFWISVGDSLLYLFRRGKIRLLNSRHVETINTGTGQVRNRIQVLRSALRGRDLELIDCPAQLLQLCAGDLIVVASDGLDCVPERKLASILRRCAARSPTEIVDHLLRAVRSKPVAEQDNTTVILYRVPYSKMSTRNPIHPTSTKPKWRLVIAAGLSATLLLMMMVWLLT